jgi:hypothetical protein
MKEWGRNSVHIHLPEKFDGPGSQRQDGVQPETATELGVFFLSEYLPGVRCND